MSDQNAVLDPVIQKGLIDFLKKKLGLLGVLHFKNSVEKCQCEPCQTTKAVLTGGDIPEPPATS
jgi:NAD-dependent SIR2 family protein deacetylase